MQNNFNDKIKNLRDFNLEPSAQVWQEIENNLDDKRKKRIVGWWWSMPVLGLLICIALVFNRNSQETLKNRTISTKNSPVFDKNNAISDKHSTIKLDDKAILLENRTIPSEHKTVLLENKAIALEHKAVLLEDKTIALEDRAIKLEDNAVAYKHSNKPLNNKAVFDESITSNVNIEASLEKNHPIVPTKIATKDIDSSKKIELNKTEIIPIAANKIIQYSLAIGGGANYLSRNNILGANENNVNYLSNTTGTATSATPPTNGNTNLALPKTGFHFSVGVNIDYHLSKKWGLQTGLMYSYLENRIGLKEDSVKLYPAYYYLSDKETYTNYSNQLEIPINISYCINPNSKNKISFQTGLNFAWIFKDNWLDKKDNIERYQAIIEQNKRILIGLQTGASINFNNKFTVSLIAKKYITPAQKSTSKYYWQQLDVQVNLPLGK